MLSRSFRSSMYELAVPNAIKKGIGNVHYQILEGCERNPLSENKGWLKNKKREYCLLSACLVCFYFFKDIMNRNYFYNKKYRSFRTLDRL